MGRKKKIEKEPEQAENSSEFEWEEVLGSGAKRSIAAIFFITLGLLFFISFFDAAGVFGESIAKGLGLAFGWGKWLFPIILFFSAFFALRRRETTLSDIVKFVGLGLVFIALLGFFHLYLGESGRELLKEAKRGVGGGYLGYFFSALLLEFTGKIAGTIILFAIFLSGMIAAFNVSLGHFFERLAARFQNRVETKGEESVIGTETFAQPEQTPVHPVASEGAVVVESEIPSEIISSETSNISNIRFMGEIEEPKAVRENVARMSFDREESSVEDIETLSSLKKSQHTRRKWNFPQLDFLGRKSEKESAGNIDRNVQIIQSTLRYFGIEVEPGEDPKIGPTVTQYSFRPKEGTRLSKIVALGNDLSLALAKHPIRIEAPIPGKPFIGIEVPNDILAKVRMRDIMESDAFRAKRRKGIPVIIGEDVSGAYEIANLETMPHLLVAGATNSGKSVCINSLLISMLYQFTPDELKLILVDPKRIELTLYDGIPHLKGGHVIVDNKHVVNALRYAVGEMERRLKLLGEVHARDLASYQEKINQGVTRKIHQEDGTVRVEPLKPIPYLVIVIDEMADLMMAHGKEVEALIVRLAQMSRAVGIHLVLATQRPSVEVVTGLIKANVPARIAFFVTNQVDSRTILDASGAEKLLGKGDMLYSPPGISQPKRLQGVFISEEEVKSVVRFWKDEKRKFGEDDIDGDFDDGRDETNTEMSTFFDDDFSHSAEVSDPQYEEAKRIVISSQRAATTYLQRRLSIGYGKAAKFLDMMEEEGIVGRPEGSNKGREVLVAPDTATAVKSGITMYEDPIADQAARDKWQM